MFRPGRMLLIVALASTTAACANLASVRTLGSSIETATTDSASIVSAEAATCKETYALIAEYNTIFRDNASDGNCEARAATLDAILQESKALQAYGKALSDLAQDQYVTTDDDGAAVSGALTNLKVDPNIVGAVGTIFTSVEYWALNGYRQKKISAALSGPAADAFKKISGDMQRLLANYQGQLDTEVFDIRIIKGRVQQKEARDKEPIASAEMAVRLTGLTSGVQAKKEALAAYAKALDDLPGAFAAAAGDVKHPDNKAILAAVKKFAAQAKDAHDKIVKAFP